MGSLSEAQTQILLAQRPGYVTDAAVSSRLETADQIGRQLRSLQDR